MCVPGADRPTRAACCSPRSNAWHLRAGGCCATARFRRLQVGVKEVVLAVSYKPEDMMEALKGFEAKYGMKVVCSVEEEPLGTGACPPRPALCPRAAAVPPPACARNACCFPPLLWPPPPAAGPLALAKSILAADGEPFFVFNSDVTCEYPLKDLLDFHRKHGESQRASERGRGRGTPAGGGAAAGSSGGKESGGGSGCGPAGGNCGNCGCGVSYQRCLPPLHHHDATMPSPHPPGVPPSITIMMLVVPAGKEGTIMVTRVDEPSKYGVVVHDDAGRIQHFVEKPQTFVSNHINAVSCQWCQWWSSYSFCASPLPPLLRLCAPHPHPQGLYCLSPAILDRIPLKPTSIEKDIFPVMSDEGEWWS